VSNLSAVFPTTGGHIILSCSVAVFLDAEFAVENGITKADDFSPYSQPPVLGCLLAPNTPDKFLDLPGLVMSTIAPEFCMPTNVDLVISALVMISQCNVQNLV